MKSRLILPAVLLLGLATACADDSADDATADSAEGATCEAFYEGTGTPLAERAENARTALTSGEITDSATYSEVNMLEQRIRELADDSPESLASVLAQINEPFDESVTEVNNATYSAPAGETPEFPDLTGIDVSGSEAAQDELDSACADAGYDPA